MFSLTHVYVAQQVFEKDNRLQALGAIFPDAAVVFGLEWDHTHRLGKELYQFIKDRNREFLPFALGVLSHGVEPRGLDYYGDECYGKNCNRGYCFQKALPIINDVRQACNLPFDYGWWKAHNFIEMAVEIKLAQANPFLQDTVEEVVTRGEEYSGLNEVLQDFYANYVQDVNVDLKNLGGFFTEGPVDVQTMSSLYVKQLWAKHGIEGVNVDQVKQLISYSGQLVDEDFNIFLTNSIKDIKGMIRSFI